MIKLSEYWNILNHINKISNQHADKLEIIRKNMRGRGVSPLHSALVESELEEIEHFLRKLASDKDHPVPVR